MTALSAAFGVDSHLSGNVDVALAYHERTKHHFNRYAPSPGFLDWATQPDPFRRFAAAPSYPLVRPDRDRTPAYEVIYETCAAPVTVAARSLSDLFYYALALSAWKQYGQSRWSLRVNPSSGNLHPTEAYLIIDDRAGLMDGPAVYHYLPIEHALECRLRLPGRAWAKLTAGLPESAFFVALSSIPWREAWKYGQRAYRYCQHDAGHALAALRLSATMLGWSCQLLNAVSDDQLGRLLGLSRPDASRAGEPEVPEMLLAFDPAGAGCDPCRVRLDDQAIEQAAQGRWYGKANQLSPAHRAWPVLDQMQIACRDAGGLTRGLPCHHQQHQGACSPRIAAVSPTTSSAGQIIRQRRSALALDGVTGMSGQSFFNMLYRVLPGVTRSPWEALCWSAQVHLGLFVHRVHGLPSGLYALVRRLEHQGLVQQATSRQFLWRRLEQVPEDLPLYLLAEGDFRAVAGQVSCHQDIASDGAFSLAMLACFEPVLAQYGAEAYRQLFWETGIIGQVLYLEAEAAGLGATGIGCFFDDPVHAVFGLRDRTLQSLYHFTVGCPVDDPRLTSLPAYG